MNLTNMFILAPLFFSVQILAQTMPASDCQNVARYNTLSCYRQELAAKQLEYQLVANESVPHKYQYLIKDILPARFQAEMLNPPVEVNRYKLTSQSWSPSGLVASDKWQHNVNIYIPRNPKGDRALLAIDLSERMMVEIAQTTHTIVVSLDNIPSVELTYQGDQAARMEDDSIARSWELYMAQPERRVLLPLQLPMSAAVSQTIRLAKKELAPWHIDRFIVTGASKRGWTSWLAGISDPSVEAIVPFVADLLNTRKMLKHLYDTYGGNWPISFKPYYQHQIDILDESFYFRGLMNIIDPMQYLGTPYQARLAIPKYIVNASGDEFFPPDNSSLYYDQLPGAKSLRVVPNSDHLSIVNFMKNSLVSFIDRLQNNQPLPTVKATAKSDGKVQLTFSEKPTTLLEWRAVNVNSRDFRYVCGMRYQATPFAITSDNTGELSLDYHGRGWQAVFVEATFADGYVATSQVYITPDDKYPTSAPMTSVSECKTLNGRS